MKAGSPVYGVEPQGTRMLIGGLTGIRTQDQRIKSPVLYQLSYQPDRRTRL